MLKTIIVLGIILIVLVVIAIQFAIGFGIYWLLLWAGSPKWIAVLCGIIYVIVSSWIGKLSSTS
jgi:hypothetical protein